MDNQQTPKTPLSDLEGWRNLCDAMSEDSLLEKPETPLSYDVAARIRSQLTRLAQEGQSPADREAQILAEQHELEHRDQDESPPLAEHDKTMPEEEPRGDDKPPVPSRRQF